VLFVRGKVGGVDENVIEVNNDTDVDHVREGVVHEMLECRGSIQESEWHDTPFEGSVSGVEGGFRFVTFGDTHKVVGMSEVDFGVDASFPRGVEEVGDEWKGVSVFFGDLVKTMVIDTQSE
jgi:hypothetical protein